MRFDSSCVRERERESAKRRKKERKKKSTVKLSLCVLYEKCKWLKKYFEDYSAVGERKNRPI